MIPSVLSQQLRQSVGIVDRLLSEDEGVFKGPFLSIAGCRCQIGVRPTQLTIKQSALQKFRPSYDLFQNLHEC